MEKEGLLRAVHNLHQRKLKISLLVTDRHRQIAKWVRENLSEADHRYDIWHVRKLVEDSTFGKHISKYSQIYL